MFEDVTNLLVLSQQLFRFERRNLFEVAATRFLRDAKCFRGMFRFVVVVVAR